ncbi:MAG: Fe-S cluster assembly protein SufB [Eubacteriales bacterium]|nr:Fe-S cluster assembly protein SufB [Eubacteriales bacterium]
MTDPKDRAMEFNQSQAERLAQSKSLEEAQAITTEYRYDFVDEVEAVFKTDRGLSADIVRQISEAKGEDAWMRDFRLKAYETFMAMPYPSWGPDLSKIDWNSFYYYFNPAEERSVESWDDVPEKIKETFNKLGIPEAEQQYLAGVSTQYESEVVYSKIHEELEEKGVIFTDTDTGLKRYPELFKKYFSKLVPPGDNLIAALNSACWSGGSFIYVPKGVKLDQPLQSYFRINSERMGQFERTLIIVDEGADLHYIEGCTAPRYSSDALHSGVIEIFVGKNARCRYTTIQNWSDNVLNLVTQRSIVEEGGQMEWVDGNIGARTTMKYPACYLKGAGARGTVISVAVAGEGQCQDSGARMIHLGPNTSSSIISKSLSRNGGNTTYRGTVDIGKNAVNAKTRVECDTLILDPLSKSDTIPSNRVHNGSSQLEHEATVSKVSEEQLFYLMSRGISEEKAMEMIVMGFIEPFTRELPMEYAIELNQLMKLDMSASQG